MSFLLKMNKILEINRDNMTAIVEPGVVLGDLQKEVEKAKQLLAMTNND